jgi:hypothetical protein
MTWALIELPDLPRCHVCDVAQLLDYGLDSWGRVWCLGCAEVADAARRPAASAAQGGGVPSARRRRTR